MMEIFFLVLATAVQFIGLVIFKYWGWLFILGWFLYSIFMNKRRTEWVVSLDYVLLEIEIPMNNDKKELSAEQMFASLHGILQPKSMKMKKGSIQEHLSFEIVSTGGKIRFFARVPKHLKSFVEGQIYAQYPTASIKEGVEDYALNKEGSDRFYAGAELKLNKNDVLPIKTFPSFEVDPLSGITAALGGMGQDEEFWIQILARPVDDAWHEKAQVFVDSAKDPTIIKVLKSNKNFASKIATLFTQAGNDIFRAMWAPPTADTYQPSATQTTLNAAALEKAQKLGYQVKIRLIYTGQSFERAERELQNVVAAFKQFNTTNLNGFSTGKIVSGDKFLDEYRARLFIDNGFILNIEELASLYHLPHESVATPNIAWIQTKTGEPPADLPTEKNEKLSDISLFGLTNFRHQRVRFGIKRSDRDRHVYIIGRSGSGKTFLLQLLTISDILTDQGLALVDPHGDYAEAMLKFVPKHRINDVVYFNPADRDFPIAFNPMEYTDPALKNNVASELVGALKKIFGTGPSGSWGPRLEHILRYTILALLDYPNATMLGIVRMLSEKEYRKKVVRQIKDPVVKNFWVNEFGSYNEKFANEAVAPILNKVGQFVANPIIRNIIGQPKSTFDIRKMMDEGKILIVNLSTGMVGEDNAALLGALMITKIQLAAMSRANVAKEERLPFYLYVDEFQNFATESFATILSEARKYGLNLTVANQYIAQMPDEVREAVFGNVGSMVTFRVGAGDAAFLVKEFEPVFEASDLINQSSQHILVKMSVENQTSRPFSATTLRVPEPPDDRTADIVAQSRQHYAIPRIDVEEKIAKWTGFDEDETTPVSEKPAEKTPVLSHVQPGSNHKTAHQGSNPGSSNRRKRGGNRSDRPGDHRTDRRSNDNRAGSNSSEPNAKRQQTIEKAAATLIRATVDKPGTNVIKPGQPIKLN